jgi:hypothetical protein
MEFSRNHSNKMNSISPTAAVGSSHFALSTLLFTYFLLQKEEFKDCY